MMHPTKGEVIIFQVVRVTSRRRISHASELALIFMVAEIKQLRWDSQVEDKVAVEESGQARASGRNQPV